jgi:hypothetical protein
MPGDPRECRDQARLCMQLAQSSRSDTERETFERFAQLWASLATDYENANLLLAQWGAPSPAKAKVVVCELCPNAQLERLEECA